MVNFNPIDYDYIVRWQSDLEDTKEIPLHKPSQDWSKSTALGGVWNFAEILRNGAFNIGSTQTLCEPVLAQSGGNVICK